MFDTETKDLVTVHTDGNEQLSTMRYSPGLAFFVQLFEQQQQKGPEYCIKKCLSIIKYRSLIFYAFAVSVFNHWR